MPQTTTDRYEKAKQTLQSVGQDHVLHFYDELDAGQQDQLLSQIESIDWPEVARLIDTHVKQVPELELPETVQPAPWYPYEPGSQHETRYNEARAHGEDLIRQGKVAAFTVAGGQGTRLGWDGPKGTFPATPIRHAPLFQVFAEAIQKASEKYDTVVPWYVMTSPANDAPTRAFFKEQNYFGLDPQHVMLFPQGMMPAIDRQTCHVLMEDKASLALSPNGHGGSLKALYQSGAIDDMKRRGVEHISYVQVDNPNVKVVDPLFIGLHALDGAQMSSKMLPKREPMEKLGNFCLVDGRVTVIEYSDLPEELAHQRLENGELRFRAGSIAIHVMRRDFVASLNQGAKGFSLPFHRAEKKVAHLDVDTQKTITHDTPNAVKLETFVFDALPMCETSIIYETDRVEEFAPIKNADGPDCQDCPRTSHALQIERAARWLEANGVTVPRDAKGNPDATIEIRPVTATESQDLSTIELPPAVDPGAELLL